MDVQALRERTRNEHEFTESLLPLMHAELTRSTYVAALQALLPVLLGWERWSGEHCPAVWRPLLAGRMRSPLLRRDLAALGAPAGDDALSFASLATDRGDDAHKACFLGALYVVEGSTLGGQFIARHAEATLGLSVDAGAAYFSGYGEQTGARWREIRTALAAAPELWLEETVGAARRTFSLFAVGFGSPAGGDLRPSPPGLSPPLRAHARSG